MTEQFNRLFRAWQPDFVGDAIQRGLDHGKKARQKMMEDMRGTAIASPSFRQALIEATEKTRGPLSVADIRHAALMEAAAIARAEAEESAYADGREARTIARVANRIARLIEARASGTAPEE